jgi:hypothetical protein
MFCNLTNISKAEEIEAFCLIKRMDLRQANLDPKDYSRFAGKEINFLISFDENLIVDVSAEDEVSVITGMYGPTDMQKFNKTANGINYKNEIDIKGDKEEEMLKYNYNNTIRIVDGKPTSLYAKVDQSGWSFNSWNFQIDCRDHKYSDAEKQQAKNLLIGEKPPTPKFDKKKADMFLRAICKRNYQNLSLEMKKKCDAAFPVNPFKKQKEYVCRNSSEESIKLKIYAIYKDKYVVISEQNPDLDNVEMVYFGKITTDDKQLTFFSINSEEKILTVFNLQEIKDNKRKFIHQMFQLDDEELKNVLNTNTVFDKKLDDPNPSVYVKQQDIEIGIVNNTINIFQSIKNMSEEKLDKKKLDLKEYFCDVNKF